MMNPIMRITGLALLLTCISAHSADLLSGADPTLSGSDNGYGTPAMVVSGIRTKCAISSCISAPGAPLDSYQTRRCNEMAAASGIALTSGTDIFEYLVLGYGEYIMGVSATGLKPGSFIAGFGVQAWYPPYYANVSTPVIACR